MGKLLPDSGAGNQVVNSDLTTTPHLEVYLLGTIELEEALRLQRRLIYDLGERGGASLILCEHPPTLSIGRSGSRGHIRPDDDQLSTWGVPMRWVNRGGGCILHLPGQLSFYLIHTLQPKSLNLQAYINRISGALVDLLSEFELRGQVRNDVPGVYLGPSRVASLGVAVNRWIAYHGGTLNVATYLEPFDQILSEPGPSGNALRQTSMEAWRQRPTPMSKVRESLIRHIELRFGLQRHHLYTDHPLVRRKPRSYVYSPSLG